MKVLATFLVAAVVGVAAPGVLAQRGGDQQPGMRMQDHDMMAMREQMMADVKASDARLDELVSKMTAARGDAKINVMADLIRELVRERKTTRDGMMQMQERMMPHMMGHMMEGMPSDMRQSMQTSMAKCPMMKGDTQR